MAATSPPDERSLRQRPDTRRAVSGRRLETTIKALPAAHAQPGYGPAVTGRAARLTRTTGGPR